MTTALVTGGTKGIGKAIVGALQNKGIKVAVMARTKTADCDLFIQADLTSIHDRHRAIQKVVDEFGEFDILVNNAGAQSHCKFEDYETTQFKRDFELMVVAPFDLSQQAARYMLVHGSGRIINILSTSAFQGARNISGYVTSKHALLGLTRTMAIELAPLIMVNAVAPGLTDTDMTQAYITPERRALLESITPAGRFCKPEEIADAVMYLVNATAMYGQTVVVDNGWCCKNGG